METKSIQVVTCFAGLVLFACVRVSKGMLFHAVSCQYRCINVYVCGLQIFALFCTIASFYIMVLSSATRLLFHIVRSHHNKWKNALPFDSTDDEEKKLLIDLILFSSSCFQSVEQNLRVNIATNERKSLFLSKALTMTKKKPVNGLSGWRQRLILGHKSYCYYSVVPADSRFLNFP